ncbi:MAG: TraR/DksA C4-type zinc finger protein [Deltaproteobacteria bacterium]|nr:TraR/DksA C4-type zinc finger protein [Deltaproteobacteria bacterium]
MTFKDVVAFHGHSCPGLAMGYRMAIAALKRMSEIRAPDEEIVVIVENNACGVDAVQCLTGATMGKGNLIFKDYGKQIYTFYSRNSKKAFRVTLNSSAVPNTIKENRDEYMAWLLDAPEEDLITVTETSIEEPQYAERRPSVRCAFCGELVMDTRTVQKGDKVACIPCATGGVSSGS